MSHFSQIKPQKESTERPQSFSPTLFREISQNLTERKKPLCKNQNSPQNKKNPIKSCANSPLKQNFDEENLISIRIKIDMNQFSEDHYIVKLSLPSDFNFKDIEQYLKVKRVIPQIQSEYIEKRMQLDRMLQEAENNCKKDHIEVVFDTKFTINEKVCSKTQNVKDVLESMRKGSTDVLVNLCYSWAIRKKGSNGKEVNFHSESTQTQQDCCNIM